MLKKLIILIVLAGLGYVGYLVSPRERATIKHKLDNAGKQIKKGASNLAAKTAKVVKKELADDHKAKTEDGQKARDEKKQALHGLAGESGLILCAFSGSSSQWKAFSTWRKPKPACSIWRASHS